MSNQKHPIRDPNVGTIIDDRYYLQTLIGRGATSSVYEATDAKEEQSVAVKLMHSHLVLEEMIVKRFEQEAKTARLLQHPNIVQIDEFNVTENGVPYLVMELVKGTSLQEVVKGAGWLPIGRALAIFSQICAALAAAHEKAIVHRDLKPSNIMLTTTDGGDLLVKILDFGIAKQISMLSDTELRLTQAGEALGSLLYMSPEQCLDQDIDNRSDCYSMGCVMYETLTGKPPLCARTAFETMNKQIAEMPERLDRVRPDLAWPAGLEQVIFKAMAKDPAHRYQKITDLQDALENISTEKSEVRNGIEKSKATASLSTSAVEAPTRPASEADNGKGSTSATEVSSPLTPTYEAPIQSLRSVYTSPELQNAPTRDPVTVTVKRSEQLRKAITTKVELNNAGTAFLGLGLFALVCCTYAFWSAESKTGNYGGTIAIGILLLAFTYMTVHTHKSMSKAHQEFMHKVTAVKNCHPLAISITKVTTEQLNIAQTNAHYRLDISYQIAGDGTTRTHHNRVFPIEPTAHVWEALCTAYQLETVRGYDSTFPVNGLIFFDTEKALAIEIAGYLAWLPDMSTDPFGELADTISGIANTKL
ncbi:MAG: protein kinase [Candidatus Melainabacteria bacterium]|nr:protein kinase [Candidatus Melainabacteria bacterium]